jgi:hypothetical protein
VTIEANPNAAPRLRRGALGHATKDLPEKVRDYVDRVVAPYFACAAEWYETVGIGVTGGELFDLVHRHLGDPFFGVHLNPGHFIHLDEWPSSPIWAGSQVQLRSALLPRRRGCPAGRASRG